MADPPALVDDPVGWARPKARILGTALLAGLGIGFLVTVLLVFLFDGRTVRTKAFAIGTLMFGFGTVGWSGSVMAGRGIENAQTYMETNTEWTERDSRRAMTRIAGFGAGVMVGVSLVGEIARAFAAAVVGL